MQITNEPDWFKMQVDRPDITLPHECGDEPEVPQARTDVSGRSSHPWG